MSMYKYFIVLVFSFFLFSCSSTVKFRALVPSPYTSSEGSLLKIKYSESVNLTYVQKEELYKRIKKTVEENKWYKLDETMGEVGDLVIYLKKLDSKEKRYSVGLKEDNGVRKHSATVDLELGLTIDLKKQNDFVLRDHLVTTESSETSEVDLPKKPGKNSLTPLFNLVIGADPEKDVIQNQKLSLTAKAINTNFEKIVSKLYYLVAPELKEIEIELMTKADDQKPVEDLASEGSGSAAKILLAQMLEKEPERTDLLNNYGAVLEKMGEYPLACSYYERSLKIEANRLVAKNLSHCLERKDNFAKIREFKK